jgi:hypothetical protein
MSSLNATDLPNSGMDDILVTLDRNVVLKNAGEEPVNGQCNGHVFAIKPGESVTVRDIKDWPLGTDGRRNKAVDPVVIVTAVQVARHLLLQAEFENRGVFVASGNADTDTKREQAAFAAYRRNRVARSLRKQADWLAIVDKTAREGGLRPVMPPDVYADIQFLKEHEHAVLRESRKRFQCKIDGFASDNRAEVEKHIVMLYSARLDATNSDPDAQIDDLEDNANIRSGSQPKQAPAANVSKELAQKADSLGINLKKAHLMGLLNEDAATIAEVRELLKEKASPAA